MQNAVASTWRRPWDKWCLCVCVSVIVIPTGGFFLREDSVTSKVHIHALSASTHGKGSRCWRLKWHHISVEWLQTIVILWDALTEREHCWTLHSSHVTEHHDVDRTTPSKSISHHHTGIDKTSFYNHCFHTPLCKKEILKVFSNLREHC